MEERESDREHGSGSDPGHNLLFVHHMTFMLETN